MQHLSWISEDIERKLSFGFFMIECLILLLFFEMWVEHHRKFPYLSGNSFRPEVNPTRHMKAKLHVTKQIHIFPSKSLTCPFPSLLKPCVSNHANNPCICSSPKLQLYAWINPCLTDEAWFSISTPFCLGHEQAALLQGETMSSCLTLISQFAGT